MKVEIFHASWNVDLYKLQDNVNAFLATLPKNAVKHVQTAMAASRTDDTDQSEESYIVSVWYEGAPKKAPSRKSRTRSN